MYCSECGVKASGKFCHACGARLATAENVPVATQPVATLYQPPVAPVATTVPWEQEVRYEALLKVPHVRTTLARLAMEAEPGISANDFLSLCDSAFKPMGPISMTKIAPVLQSMYGSWGIKTGKQRQAVFPLPPGVVLFRVLCSLTTKAQKIKNVSQGEDGCILHVTIPSSMWTMEGQMLITITRLTAGTQVEAVTKISGQLYDWGVSNKILDQLFSSLQSSQAA